LERDESLFLKNDEVFTLANPSGLDLSVIMFWRFLYVLLPPEFYSLTLNGVVCFLQVTGSSFKI